MLELASLRGSERILDVGTGRGLLAVGAARRLPSGGVVAVDIWKSSDLTDNRRERTRATLEAEGVSDRVRLAEPTRLLSRFRTEPSTSSSRTSASTTSRKWTGGGRPSLRSRACSPRAAAP
jgi:methylase of polypeptide subunit release factors